MYNIVEDGVKIGKNFKIGSFCKLAKGTVIGDNVILNDYVSTTGACYIGDNTEIKAGTVISRGVEIGKNCFIGVHVATGSSIPTKGKMVKVVTHIGNNVEIYSHVNIVPGIFIADGTIIGAASNIIKNVFKSGLLVGNPAKLKWKHFDNYKKVEPNFSTWQDNGFIRLYKDDPEFKHMMKGTVL